MEGADGETGEWGRAISADTAWENTTTTTTTTTIQCQSVKIQRDKGGLTALSLSLLAGACVCSLPPTSSAGRASPGIAAWAPGVSRPAVAATECQFSREMTWSPASLLVW